MTFKEGDQVLWIGPDHDFPGTFLSAYPPHTDGFTYCQIVNHLNSISVVRLDQLQPVKQFFTFEEIVAAMIKQLPAHEAAFLKTKKKEDLIIFHHTVGQDIRNNYKLWYPENPLTSGYAEDGDEKRHPDTVSMDIIEAIWIHCNGL